ncbi:MAG TPA: AIM24 family protein [Chloroflexia bacterium]|nr:AIM24 family protein [Chloroflexia bacterium]
MAGYVTQPPGPPAAGAGRSYTCPWCGTVSDGSSLSCPACGSPVDVRVMVNNSGWAEMPGIKDMARIQFGQSTCQIEGTLVPIADMNLAPSDAVYFTHHVLLWKDPQPVITTMTLKGGWKRLFAGLPLIMTQAQGPGHIAFSKDHAGEMIALPIQPGQAVDLREHVFMVATANVTYDWFQTGIWFRTKSGDDTETHYPMGMFMDRFFAPQTPGLLLLHAKGNVFIRTLAPNQTVLIKPTALLFKDPTVQMQLHVEHPGGTWRSWRSWGERYLWVRMYGPGRVAVESAFEAFEDPGYNFYDAAPHTRQRW